MLARALAATVVNGDPSSYEEAMASPQKEHWKEAIREECNSILRNNTFAAMGSAVSTGMPTSNRPIGSKWVFKTKTNPR